MNYSFISGKKLEQFRVQAGKGDVVKIINPINEDFEYLRPTLLPAMVDNVSRNLKYRIQDMALFEVSRVFKKVEAKLPGETVMLGILLTGKKQEKGWNTEEAAYDFYDLKGIAEYLAERYYPESGLQLIQKEMAFFHPVVGATVSMGKQEMGIMGQIHPGLLAQLDIDQPYIIWNLTWTSL
ncbi:MAG: hypothetical protein U5N58_00800 [Actinomycetota bacterium]|nr:hypothetical protein [Actinomycetota bacterium]